ncbi:MAG: carboxymuconolactone decarboxylase family protein [Candidatus Lokiarchaeota archaeon]
MKDAKDLLKEIEETFQEYGQINPEAMNGFKKFMSKTKEDGALSRKMKEIIGVALSVSRHCEWCVPFHVKNALDAGATKQEIMEACLVAVMMGGGPSLMFTKKVLEALEDLSD